MTNLTNEKIDEILAGMYGLGVGKTPKEVLASAHPNSLIYSEIQEAKQSIFHLIHQAEIKARIDELNHLRIPTQTLKDQVDARIQALEKEIK